MSLRYALLALLTSRPMTGYELSKQFSQSADHVWHAPDSQIYPELRRMERDGLVEVSEERFRTSGVKKEYAVTDVGLAAFRAWIDEPIDIKRQRDPAYLKAAYWEWADPDAARSQLRAHAEHWSAHAAMLRETRRTLLDGTHPTLAHRLAKFPAAEHERIVRFKVLAYDGLIERADLEAGWAERGIALLDELSPR